MNSEQNAIADCAKRGVSCKGSTAYITHYLCIDCYLPQVYVKSILLLYLYCFLF